MSRVKVGEMLASKPFNPEDYSNRTCCGVFEYLHAVGLVYPFQKRVALNMSTMGLSVTRWKVRLFRVRSDGVTVSTSSAPLIDMDYCPFCGAYLGPAKEAPDEN